MKAAPLDEGVMEVGPFGDDLTHSLVVLKDRALPDERPIDLTSITNIVWYVGDENVASVCGGPPLDDHGLRDGWKVFTPFPGHRYYITTEALRHYGDRYFRIIAVRNAVEWVYGVTDTNSVMVFGVRESVYVGEPR